MEALTRQAECAKIASRTLLTLSSKSKDTALTAIADALIQNEDVILRANAQDIELAQQNNMTPALIDRLTLDSTRINAIAGSVLEVAALADPIGRTERTERRPNGLEIGRRIVPLGVIAIIFEARPNVTVDAAVLCLKSGNAVILRGGKEAYNSNLALCEVMRNAVSGAGLPSDCISLVQDTSRQSVTDLLELSQYIDVIIPRGGAGLINHVKNNSKIPVIETGVGNCHVYVHKDADLDMAAQIVFNAKCRRPPVCNAAETLLVDKEIASEFLPMVKTLLDTKNTELRCCELSRKILGAEVKPASEDDYYTEFLDYILAVKAVEDVNEAISHITQYGTKHSEAIVTNNYAVSRRFTDEVDAAAVYVNASTGFTDGGEFGLGAEIGISTQKLHARGPMGLNQLTSSKFVVFGSGQVR